MNIVILGAGQVGSSLARNLANEDNDITIIDNDGIALRELREKLDINTHIGQASHPDVLEQANVNDADIEAFLTLQAKEAKDNFRKVRKKSKDNSNNQNVIAKCEGNRIVIVPAPGNDNDEGWVPRLRAEGEKMSYLAVLQTGVSKNMMLK